jgi:hypothetical protein
MSSELCEDFNMIDIDVDGKKLIRMAAVDHIVDFNLIDSENTFGADKIGDI